MGQSYWRYIALCIVVLCAAWASPAFAQSSQVNLGELVVTATGRPEAPSRIVGTTQVITQEQIANSKATSVTELLAESAVGFINEWSNDQTQIEVRGGLTEGQGRDFKSEVLVLINGHRAGTSNVSKLSLADVDHIEIIRGPSSVVYGSQNMGGIINIIMKTGRTAPGSLVETQGGSWGLSQSKAQTGGVKNNVDWYGGVSYGTEGNYQIGGPGWYEANTGWHRHGETAAVGYQIDPNNRVDFDIRQDGIYDAGFRGSSWSTHDQDTRYNGSLDTSFSGKTPNGAANWFFQFYDVQDVDSLNQPSVSTATSVDLNDRKQDLTGTRFQPRFDLWPGNDLLLGWDFEHEQLRSTRFDVGTTGLPLATQPSPTDNNQHVDENAYYFEDAQTLFDRLTVRGGLRQTFGATTLDWTPGSPGMNLRSSTHDYQALTYSGGVAWNVNNWLSTRVGASSGFLAPTATEFGQNYIVASTGSVTYGNPSIQPEHSQQIEVGLTATRDATKFDIALYENRIMNRLTTEVIGSTGGAHPASISQYVNNPGAVVLQGVELQYNINMLKLMSSAQSNWFWNLSGNAYYNFHMVDDGIATIVGPAFATTSKPLRTYESQLSVDDSFGQHGAAWHDWSFDVQGIVNGRMWYNTEEQLIVPGAVANKTIFEKSPYTVWNIKGELKVAEGVNVWAKVDNIFNLDYQPIFIALNGVVPCLGNPVYSNGSCGNSLPGRDYMVGVTARF